MKAHLYTALLAFPLLVACAANPSDVGMAVEAGEGAACCAGCADEERAWTVLFDGNSLEAWRGFNVESVTAGWQIEGDALVRTASTGDLITREQFGSFVLEFQWQVSPGANSGVFFHVTEENSTTYQSGPEYQILDNSAHTNGLDPLTSAAANYGLHAPSGDHTRPVGEWNDGRIEVRDGTVRHWLNGVQVVEYQLGSESWLGLVKDSKFDAWPPYGVAGRGHIALQDHGDRVAYRNIRIQSFD